MCCTVTVLLRCCVVCEQSAQMHQFQHWYFTYNTDFQYGGPVGDASAINCESVMTQAAGCRQYQTESSISWPQNDALTLWLEQTQSRTPLEIKHLNNQCLILSSFALAKEKGHTTGCNADCHVQDNLAHLPKSVLNRQQCTNWYNKHNIQQHLLKCQTNIWKVVNVNNVDESRLYNSQVSTVISCSFIASIVWLGDTALNNQTMWLIQTRV